MKGSGCICYFFQTVGRFYFCWKFSLRIVLGLAFQMPLQLPESNPVRGDLEGSGLFSRFHTTCDCSAGLDFLSLGLMFPSAHSTLVVLTRHWAIEMPVGTESGLLLTTDKWLDHLFLLCFLAFSLVLFCHLRGAYSGGCTARDPSTEPPCP